MAGHNKAFPPQRFIHKYVHRTPHPFFMIMYWKEQSPPFSQASLMLLGVHPSIPKSLCQPRPSPPVSTGSAAAAIQAVDFPKAVADSAP